MEVKVRVARPRMYRVELTGQITRIHKIHEEKLSLRNAQFHPQERFRKTITHFSKQTSPKSLHLSMPHKRTNVKKIFKINKFPSLAKCIENGIPPKQCQIMRNYIDVGESQFILVKQDNHLARPRNYSLFDQLLTAMKPKPQEQPYVPEKHFFRQQSEVTELTQPLKYQYSSFDSSVLGDNSHIKKKINEMPPDTLQEIRRNALQRLQSVGKISNRQSISSSQGRLHSLKDLSIRRKSSALKVTNIEFERPTSESQGTDKKRILTLSPKTAWSKSPEGRVEDETNHLDNERPASAIQIPHYHKPEINNTIRVPSFLPGTGSVESNISVNEKISDSERVNTLIRDQSREEMHYGLKQDKRRQYYRLSPDISKDRNEDGKISPPPPIEKRIERRDGELTIMQKEIHMHVPSRMQSNMDATSSQEMSLFADNSEHFTPLLGRKLSMNSQVERVGRDESPFHSKKEYKSVHIPEEVHHVTSPSSLSEVKKIEEATSPYHSSAFSGEHQKAVVDSQRTLKESDSMVEQNMKRPTIAVLNKINEKALPSQLGAIHSFNTSTNKEDSRVSHNQTFTFINMDPRNIAPAVESQGITPTVRPNPAIVDRQAIRRKLGRTGSPVKQQEMHIVRYKGEPIRQMEESQNNSIRDGTSRLEAGQSANSHLQMEPHYAHKTQDSSPGSQLNESPRQRVCLFQAGKTQNTDINEESDSNFDSVMQNAEHYIKLGSPKNLILQSLLPAGKQQDIVKQIIALASGGNKVDTFRTNQPPTLRDQRYIQAPYDTKINTGFIRMGGNQALVPINSASRRFYQNQVNFYEIRPVAPIKRSDSRPSTTMRQSIQFGRMSETYHGSMVSSMRNTMKSLQINNILLQEPSGENSVVVSAEFGGGLKESATSSKIIPIIRREEKKINSKLNSDIGSSNSLVNSAIMSENRKSKQNLEKESERRLLSLQKFHLDKQALNKEISQKQKSKSEHPKFLNQQIAVGMSYRYLTRRSGDPPYSGKSGVYLPAGTRTAPQYVHSMLPPSVLTPAQKYPIPTVNLNEMVAQENDFKKKESTEYLHRRSSPSNISTEQYRKQVKKKYQDQKKIRIQSSHDTRRRGNIEYLLPYPSASDSPSNAFPYSQDTAHKTAPSSVTTQMQQNYNKYKTYENFRISNSRLSNIKVTSTSNVLEVPTVNAAVGLATSAAPSHFDDQKSDISLHVKGVASLDSTKRKDSSPSQRKKETKNSPVTKRMSMMEFRKLSHVDTLNNSPKGKRRPDSAGYSLRSRSSSPPPFLLRTFNNFTSYDITDEGTPLESKLNILL